MAEELSALCAKLLKAAEGAEAGKEGKEERALDILKRLQEFQVNTKLLLQTEAAKQLKKLTKHPVAKIGANTTTLIKHWKATVVSEASENPPKADEKPKPPKVTVPESPAAEEAAKPAVGSPTTPGSNPNTGDPARDKLAITLGDALAKVPEETENPDGLADPRMVGIAIEKALAAKFGAMSKEYKAKYRSISFNLKDARNPDLRRKVLEGDISPYMLLTLSASELASDKARAENEKIRLAALEESVRGQTTQCSTDQFKCGKCGQRKCIYYQMQTRSADEPMTTFGTPGSKSLRYSFRDKCRQPERARHQG